MIFSNEAESAVKQDKKMHVLPVVMVLIMICLGQGNFFVSSAVAQDDSRRVYNRTYNSGAPLFNSYSGSSTLGRPLSIRQMLENRDNAATGDYTYYGGTNYRPYGIDNSSFSLGMDEAKFRASRARRDSLAQQRERENELLLQSQSNYDEYPSITSQGVGYDPAAPVYNQGGQNIRLKPLDLRRKNQRKKNGFEMPSRVFNSIE